MKKITPIILFCLLCSCGSETKKVKDAGSAAATSTDSSTAAPMGSMVTAKISNVRMTQCSPKDRKTKYQIKMDINFSERSNISREITWNTAHTVATVNLKRVEPFIKNDFIDYIALEYGDNAIETDRCTVHVIDIDGRELDSIETIVKGGEDDPGCK